MNLRADRINEIEGALPDSCILPRHYTLAVSSDRETCINPECQHQKLHIQRTVWRYPIGILLGQPKVMHRIKKCPLCKREYPFEQLHHLIPPHGNYAYDIIIYVGMARFRHHRQDIEIQQQLLDRFKLQLPQSTINALAHQFLDYFSAVHYAKVNDIVQLIQSNGGYVAHFDGTCEAGTSVLFSGIDEISGIVLLTARMPSENIGEVKKFFTECKNLYDHPLAVMRDLSTNYQPAIKKIFDDSVDLICQYHFLENVGKALLKETHQELTNLIRKSKVKPSFKSIRKKLVQSANDNPSIPSKQLEQLIKKNDSDFMHNLNLDLDLDLDKDKNILQKHLTYFILRWLDDYSSELKGEYFPFDQPALVYYRRCIYIYDLLQSLLDDSSQIKPKKKMTLSSIVRNIESLKNDKKIQQVANRLEKQVNLFSQLRDILRFNRPDKKPILRQHPPATATIEEVKETAEKLKQFRQDLHVKTKSKQTDHDIKCASKKTIYYLDKYMDELVGHLVTIPGKNKVILLHRTNNLSEQHFSKVKRGWRRKLGVKKMTRYLQAARHEELLLANLDQADYIKIVYDGSTDNMSSLFATYCHQARQLRKLRNSGQEESRSLPIEKKLLRKPDVLPDVVEALRKVLKKVA